MKKLLLLSCVEQFYPKINQVFGENLKNMNVLCIPTAAYAEDNHEWLWPEIEIIKNNVKSFVEFDIAKSDEYGLTAAIKGKDIIYVTGGNTYVLLEHLKRCNLKAILAKHFDNDGWYMGASAGSIVMSDDISYVASLDEPSKANLSDTKGLNLVDFRIMPHLDHNDFVEGIKEIMPEIISDDKELIGINDDQGIMVKGSFIKVI